MNKKEILFLAKNRHLLRFVATEDTSQVGLTTLSTYSANHAWFKTATSDLEPGQRALVIIGFESPGFGVVHRFRPTTEPTQYAGRSIQKVGTVENHTSEETYLNNVAKALHQIRQGSINKVVIGRTAEIYSDTPICPAGVLNRLIDANAGHYYYKVPLSSDLEGAWLVGASPELLISRFKRHIQSNPLAGSAPNYGGLASQADRREQLLTSAKNLAEHAVVPKYIVDRLREYCSFIDFRKTPVVVCAGTLLHLATPIKAILREDRQEVSALDLALVLHPTPAVAGIPLKRSLDLIAELESAPRNAFTGAIGWLDSDGDGEFALVIRSGILESTKATLFAGAGIVHDSSPAEEFAETKEKFETMRRALGVG